MFVLKVWNCLKLGFDSIPDGVVPPDKPRIVNAMCYMGAKISFVTVVSLNSKESVLEPEVMLTMFILIGQTPYGGIW